MSFAAGRGLSGRADVCVGLRRPGVPAPAYRPFPPQAAAWLTRPDGTSITNPVRVFFPKANACLVSVSEAQCSPAILTWLSSSFPVD